jgi:hypothetical protein
MNYIFYTHHFNENSGGSSLFFILCEFLKNKFGLNNFYIAPLICRGDGMIDRGYIKQYNLNENDYVFDSFGNSINFIDNLNDDYYNPEKYNWPKNYKSFLVTKEILNNKNNVAIYTEGILGNPLQQKFVWRWILYFPTPGLPVYPYNPWGKKDKFVFWLNSYFKNKDEYYRAFNDGNKICASEYYPEEKDILYLKYLFVHEKINLNYKDNNETQKARKGSCFLVRKSDPNYNRTFGNNWNDGVNYNINHPHMKPKPPVFIHPSDSICIDSYGLNDLIEIFKKTEYFYCYDLYTFHNCIALLYGCKVIMGIPEGKLSKEDWHCNDKCYLDYVAWGDSKEELYKAEFALENINYGDIIKNIQDDFISEFEDFYKKIELYFENVQKDFFNSSLKNKFFDGNNFLTINYKNNDNYTKNFSSNFWEIEIDFIIKPDNEPYANIFDMNFNNINYGPRLEYNNKTLSLIIGNENVFKGIIIDDNIEVEELYILKIKFEAKTMSIYFNNILKKYNIYICPNYFENIVIGKGFNEERYFKGLIQKFNLIIY